MVCASQQLETGTRTQEVCRKKGTRDTTFYNNWKKKYGGQGVSKLGGHKNFGAGNSQLKKPEADPSLEKQVLQGEPKKLQGRPENAGWAPIRMEYNSSVQHCYKLVLLHKNLFYYKTKGQER